MTLLAFTLAALFLIALALQAAVEWDDAVNGQTGTECPFQNQ